MVSILFAVCIVGTSLAQQNDEEAPITLISTEDQFMQSLFFNQIELAALNKAAIGVVLGGIDDENSPPLKREIRLAGLVYDSPNDWIIWLNGHRMTPGNILPEIVEIKVNKTSVFLRWYDAVLKQVLVITLRPHQVYDIQSGILLPG